MPEVVLDNSAYARIRTSLEVREALLDHLTQPLTTFRSVLVQRLEIGMSVRNAVEYDREMAALEAVPLLPQTAEVAAQAQVLQRALVAQGTHRGPKVVDLVIAATALVHDATVLHYDADYDLLSGVEPRLRARWVVPRGSVP